MDEPHIEPVLSVVVVSFNGAALLDKCMAALIAQPDSWQIEIHVVSKEQRQNVLSGGSQSLRIHWHKVSSSETIPSMRSFGILQSNADLIALIEDDCIVGEQWLKSVLSAHQSGHVAVGGAIEPGHFDCGLDWGVFYCEYGRFLAPFAGKVNVLPGNNVSYQSKALDHALINEGFYEVFIHEKWQKSGNELFAAAGMVVMNKNSWKVFHCTINPFHHGRAYASQRFGDQFSLRRLVYGLLALTLPVVKSLRTYSEIRSKKRTDLPLLKALPWVIIFQSCWSVGEFMGYLVGPGDSIERWG